jgi:hypothetical protein
MRNQESNGASGRSRIVTALRELIGALDRRAPRIERMGEIGVAREAAILRLEAVTRIEKLRQAGTDRCYDQELVDAIMTDDGGPWPESA